MPLSLAETATRALLFCFINEHHRGRSSSSMAWLAQRSVACPLEVSDADMGCIEARAFRRFVVHGRRPGPGTLAVCIWLLEDEGYLISGHTLLETNRSRKSTVKRDQQVGTAALAGLFYDEQIDFPDASIATLILSRSDCVKERYDAFGTERIYRASSSEVEGEFEARLDLGGYDSLLEVRGSVVRVATYWYFRPLERYDEETLGVFRCSVSMEGTSLVLRGLRPYYKRTLRRIAPSDHADLKQSENLTARQKNNIIMYSDRLFFGLKPPSKERGMNNELSELDLELLDATRKKDPVRMMLALTDGANVNAIEPETGSTPLHIAAEAGEPTCLYVLIYKPQLHQDLLDTIEDAGNQNRVEVDLAVRTAQANVDFTALDHEGQFAVNRAPLPPEGFEFDDPVGILQLENAIAIANPTSDALEGMGVNGDLFQDDLFTPEERRRVMGEARRGSDAGALPPEPDGMA